MELVLWSPTAVELPVVAPAFAVGAVVAPVPVVVAGGLEVEEAGVVGAVATASLDPVFAVLVPLVTTVAPCVFVSSGPAAPAGVGAVGSLCGTVGGGVESVVSIVAAGAVSGVVDPLADAAGGSSPSACACPLKSSKAQKPNATRKSARTVTFAVVANTLLVGILLPGKWGGAVGPSPGSETTIT